MSLYSWGYKFILVVIEHLPVQYSIRSSVLFPIVNHYLRVGVYHLTINLYFIAYVFKNKCIILCHIH